MKKAYTKSTSFAVLLLTGVMGLTGCGPNNHSSSVTTPPTSNTEGDVFADADLIINYYRFDENYTDWGLWSWSDDNAGTGMVFDHDITRKFPATGEWTWVSLPITFGTNYTVYSDWNFSVSTEVTLDQTLLDGIIIRDKSGSKDVDADRNFDYAKVDSNGVLNTYFVTGNTSIFYDIADVPVVPIKDVYLADSESVTVENYFANPDLSAATAKIKDEDGKSVGIEEVTANGTTQKIVLSTPITDITKRYKLEYDSNSFDISFKKYYNSAAFNSLYEYTGSDLGAVVSGSSTTYKLWSPAATAVSLNLYESATSEGSKETVTMEKGAKGIWSYTKNANMHGKYYNYSVTLYGNTNTVADPYAASSNANGVRSMVVDWANISGELAAAPDVSSPSKISVYETHVRDFSMGESWSGTPANRGKYLGLIESGTRLSTGEATGFDYVKELGVSHIQLQPIYDFNSVDETKLEDPAYQTARRGGIYNWGYDPYSYASLEGSYSSNPNDGLTRIDEFRKVTNAYNAAGIGVIMDVVYNHMPSEQNSTYNKIMPDYYFRSNSYSGAGSDLASENSMVKNMIVQTTSSLVKHYNLAGFRFDLMGLITKAAMKEVASQLQAINPDIILYGEGWTMYNGDRYLGDENQAVQGSMYHVETAKEGKIGYFNDTFRDGMKGNVFNEKGKGFLQTTYSGTAEERANLANLKLDVEDGLSATKAKNKWASHFSGVSVNYVEAHDNLTLRDKLYMTNPELSEEVRHAMQAQANEITALATGVSFFQAGSEFARSKELPSEWLTGDGAITEKISCSGEGADRVCFVNDSYNFSDRINAIDWSLVKTNSAMVQSFKKALELRGSAELAALSPASLDNYGFASLTAAEAGVSEEKIGGILAYKVSDLTADNPAKSVAILFNTTAEALTLGGALGTSATSVYVDGAKLQTGLPASLAASSYLVVVY